MWLARALGNDTTLLETLKKNSPTLLEVAQDFEASYSNVDIVCFYEQRDGINWFSRPSNNKWFLIFYNVDREYSDLVDLLR